MFEMLSARGWRLRWLGATLWCAGILLATHDGFAQSASEKEQARAYATEAGDLLDNKQYERALELVEKAEALYHAPTHLLFKGEALEGLGRLTEAIATYERLAAEPLPATSPEAFRRAQQTADERIGDLLARAPSVLIVVRGPRTGQTTIELDGEAVDLSAGVARRLDPGTHTLVVTAPGYQQYEKELSLRERGGVVKLEVVLQPEVAGQGAPAGTGTREPPQPPNTRKPSPLDQPEAEARRLTTPAWIAFGVGAAGLIVGGVTGTMSYLQVKDIEDRCPGGTCDPAEQSNIDGARTLGNVATGALIVGAIGAATGVVLYSWTSDEPEAGDAPPTQLVVRLTEVSGSF
jgi:hypothetical protein